MATHEHFECIHHFEKWKCLEMGCTERYSFLVSELEASLRAGNVTAESRHQSDTLRNTLRLFFPDGALFDCHEEIIKVQPINGYLLYVCSWCKRPIGVQRSMQDDAMTSHGICLECKTNLTHERAEQMKSKLKENSD
ncbi:MAG: hypothetical protein IAF08_09405 [Rhizobacter sp.]|nr:hypothetical protein [Chlorobiales bacterium]